ncbi:hypothetical protein ACOMHN_039116 [Nucella lapillus]
MTVGAPRGPLGCEVTAHYQLDFPTASTVDYAMLTIDQPLTAITVSFWMLSNDYDNYGTAFSYALPSMDNALTLTDYNGFAFYVNQESVITDVATNDDYWHHVVITWSSVRGNWKIYVDGLLNDSGFDLSTARPVPGRGTLVIGQEQDSVGGGFSANEAFVGSLTLFNIWDEELSLRTIESMRVSCREFHGNVVAWPDVQGSLKGSLAPQPSPFCQECPVPPDVEFGTVTYESLTPGSEVTYSCQRGFNVAGPPSTICLVTTEYELAPPSCQRVDCGHPGSIDNGYFNEWRFHFDSRVRYRCNRGFKIQGTETLYCNEYGEWEGDQPQCVEITCALPQLSENTLLIPPRVDPFRPGERATLGCSEGHKLLTSHDSVTCQNDGTWDRSVPTCDPQTCASPPFIPNGEPDTARDEYNVGDIVRYMCDFGYNHNPQGGNPTGALSCLPSGEWQSPEPECVLVTCDDPPLVAHASTAGEGRSFLSTVTYECSPGYAYEGNGVIECLETGEWDPEPPRCQPVDCGAPPDLPNGKVEGSDFSFNDVVTCTCLSGYKLVGNMRRQCNESGLWHGPDPVCQPVACQKLSDPNHGQVNATNITFQSEAVYACDEGYNIVGDASRTCTAEARWSGSEPQCQPVTCDDIPDFPYGSFQGPAAYTFGARVVFSCQQGYELLGEGEAVCTSEGHWSHEVPVCYPMECDFPDTPQHGSVDIKGLTFTSKIEYSCERDYRLEGVAVRTCEADGAWSGEEPVCVSAVCQPPPEIPNGDYDYKDLKIGSIVRYSCHKGYRLEGYEVRRCQTNLTLSGVEPTCVSIICPAPAPPVHGSVTLSDPTRIVGAMAVYSCDFGHHLEGEKNHTCGSRGVFIGTSPRCRPAECDKPGDVISNGRMLGTTFTFNSSVSYVCDEGYRMEGEAQRTCQADGQWDRPIPGCIAVECPRPSVVNGSPSTFRREFGTVVSFSCRGRHRLEGSSQRTCLADGSWSGDDTVCVKIVCPRPLPLLNGISRQTGDVTVTYTCDEGYSLDGSNTSTCSEGGEWEPAAPTCVLITCPDISSVTLLNGIVIFSENFGNYGSQIQYQCNSGHILVGSSQRACTLTGQWEAEAPTCQILSCPQPAVVLNGSVLGDVFTFGSEVSYECDEGHILAGLASRRCQADGSWEGEDPQCHPAQCPQIDAVLENGIVTLLSTTFGSQVRYSCLFGFMLQGDYVQNCTASGEWSGSQPVCVSLECPPPPPIEHGAIVGENYGIGRSVMYSCAMGHRPVGSTVLVCLPNLMWSGLAPVCQRITCPPLPPLEFGTAVGDGHRYGDGILFVCDPGYELIGEFSRSCQADGAWDGDLPECAPVSCGLPPMTDHAMPDLTNGTLFPAVITYHCDVGYIPEGDGVASCLTGGSWSETAFSCQLVTCADLPASYLENGNILGDDFSFGQVVRFECNVGYVLKGTDSVTCMAEGYWNGEIPMCRLVTCAEPDAVSHCTVTVQGYSYNDTATYACVTGYRLSGEATSRCTETGVWSQEARECVLITCEGPPPTIPNGHLLGSQSSFVYEDSVEYQCDVGFELVGTGRLICSLDGVFVPSVPSCSKIQCPSPSTPQHGNVQIMNDTLLYSCVAGYELAGSPTRRCLATGQWQGAAPVCIAILCSPPLPVPNGSVQGNDFQFGSSVTYACDPGFILQGQATRTCMAFRAWSGAEPVCVRVSCGPPRPIEHGTVLRGSYLFNDSISYECQLGFAPVGQTYRVCQESAAWSGEDPYCDEIMCEHPPDIVNATHDADSPSDSHFSFGSLVMYTCDVGHYMSDSSSIVCQEDGGWSHPLPQCPPVACPPLGSLDHGSMEGDDNTFGGEFLFECDEGYRLDGVDSVVCLESGRWDDALPVCERVVCALPGVQHGLVLLQGQGENELPPTQFLPGDTAEFRCVPGFVIGGSMSSRCLEDGQWSSPAPICLRVICGPPPAIFLARASAAIGPHYAGDSVTYHCDLGYEMEGEASLLCDSHGAWSGTYPTCVDVVCDDPPRIENADIAGQDFSRSWSTPAGGWIQYECREGFKLEEGHDGRLACQRGGVWENGELPQCVHIDCGPPPVPFNASVTSSGSTAGSLATVMCNRGHYLPGGDRQMEMVCDVSGTWAGAGNVHCGPVDCLLPPQIPNTAPLGSISTTYKGRVSYQCLPGYRLSGHGAVQCSEDGSWLSLGDQAPACDPVDCGPPQTNMEIVGSEFTFGSTLTLTCPEGTRAEGSDRVTCMSDGRWSPEPGRCEKIRCPPVALPEHGYTTSRDDGVGGTLVVQCGEGYQLTGGPVLTCQSNGSWDLPVPTCQLLRDVETMCVADVNTERAVVPPGDHFPGDRVALSCRPGYQPEGDMTSLCLDNRTWTEPAGECRRLSCGPPPVEDRHRVKVFGRSYLYGDRVMYMCRRGMAPARVPPTLVCTHTGDWDGVAACMAQCKQPCRNGGRCVGLNKCKCMSGYTGRLCQIPICILPCLNGGKCLAPYRCQCQQGYYGSRCHKAVCQRRCENGGRCVHPNRCQCFNGFRPPFCAS